MGIGLNLIAITILPLLCASVTSIVDHTTKKRLVQTLGTNSQLFVGGLGVVVHEFSHLLTAILFSHKIIRVKFLDFSHNNTGTLGNVITSRTKNSLWQILGNFFIGIAPFYLGSVVLWIGQMLTIGNTYNDQTMLEMLNRPLSGLELYVTDLAEQLRQSPTILIVIFTLMSLMIGSTVFDLSKEDLKVTISGFLYLVFIVLAGSLLLEVVNLNTYVNWLDWWIIKLTIYFMLNGIIASIISTLTLSIVHLVKNFRLLKQSQTKGE